MPFNSISIHASYSTIPFVRLLLSLFHHSTATSAAPARAMAKADCWVGAAKLGVKLAIIVLVELDSTATIVSHSAVVGVVVGAGSSSVF